MARKWPVVLFFALLIFVTACGSTYQLVQLPARDADLYPFSETRSGVSVAVIGITDPKQTVNHFGTDLIAEDILPVHFIVSNHSAKRQLVGPSDVLVTKGQEIIEPLPIEIVAATVKKHTEDSEEIDKFLSSIVLNETVVAPGETYHGVLFFEVPVPPLFKGSNFRVLSPFQVATLKTYVAVTNTETRERTHFGPFGLHY